MRSEADVAGTILIPATTRPSGGYGSPIRAAPRIDPFVFSPLALAILGLELIPWKKQGRSGLRTLLIALSIIRLGAVAIWGFMEGRRELAREADFSPAQASKAKLHSTLAH